MPAALQHFEPNAPNRDVVEALFVAISLLARRRLFLTTWCQFEQAAPAVCALVFKNPQ